MTLQTIPDDFSAGTKTIPGYGFCFPNTHKSGDFSVISVTERGCAPPTSKVERHI